MKSLARVVSGEVWGLEGGERALNPSPIAAVTALGPATRVYKRTAAKTCGVGGTLLITRSFSYAIIRLRTGEGSGSVPLSGPTVDFKPAPEKLPLIQGGLTSVAPRSRARLYHERATAASACILPSLARSRKAGSKVAPRRSAARPSPAPAARS
jgi:hypothetical protein